MAFGHAVRAQGIARATATRSQYDIRPTIEYYLGMTPDYGIFRGHVMTELVAAK